MLDDIKLHNKYLFSYGIKYNDAKKSSTGFRNPRINGEICET